MGRQLFVEIDPETGLLPGIEEAALETVAVRKHPFSLGSMAHVFLHPEVVHGRVEMDGGRKRDGREVGGAVKACLHVVDLSQSRDFPQMRDPSSVRNRHTNVIDKLFANQ